MKKLQQRILSFVMAAVLMLGVTICIEPMVSASLGESGVPSLGASGPGIAPSSGVMVGSNLTVHLSGKSLEEEVKELVLPATVQRLTITGRLTQADLDYIWNWTGDYDTGSGTTELTGLTRLDLGGAALPGAGVPDYQFCGHSTLNQIVLPVSLRSIGEYAFAGTGLTELDLKEYHSLTGIGAGAFREVNNLKIVLPAQVTLLKTDTFADCDGLELCLLYNGVVSCEAGALTNAQGYVEVYHGQLGAYNASSEWYGVNTGTYDCTMTIFGVVTYLGGEGQGEYTELPISYNENYVIKSADDTGISRTGYVSTQWNTQADGSGTSYFSGDQIALQSHMTLYAMWVPDNSVPKVTLTLYDASLVTTPVLLPSGSDHTLGDAGEYGIADPSGQLFRHWNTAQDGSGDIYYPGNVITIDGDRALYGQWTTATSTLTVAYDSNGGTGSGSDTAAYGNALTIGSGSGISRIGYVLESWNTKPDGSGRKLLPADTLLVYDDVTLYAQWAPESGYTVEYRDAGGQLLSSSSSLGYGDSYAILDGNELADVTGAFRFWSERPDGSGTRYNPGQGITVTGSLVLYAQCGAVPVTLRLEPDNGDATITLTTTWPGLYPTLYTPVKWGHIFRGWYDDPTGGSLVESGDAVSRADNRTLYARWEAILALDPLTGDNASVGVAYSRGITARYIGYGSLTYTPTGLPGGLGIDAGTGVISGTPAQGAQGSYAVTVSVTDGTYSDTAGFTLTVAGQSTPTIDGQVNGSDSVYLMEGYAAPYTKNYTIAGDPTPSVDIADDGGTGATIDSAGLLTIPTGLVVGTYTIKFEAVNIVGTAAMTVTVTVSKSGTPGSTYTISFHENYGSNNIFTTMWTGPDGKLTSLPTPPTRGSYRFDGWFTQASGGTQITTSYVFAANTTVYAHWAYIGGSSSARSSGSGGTDTADSRVAKTQLPASAFSWDGERTLTIDHDSVTALGLLSVRWNDGALTRGTEFSAYEGSVIIRFSEDFIAAQSPGSHHVRVEFLNHTGETTITVGAAAAIPEDGDNETYNPNTGGYSDGSSPRTTGSPDTGGRLPASDLAGPAAGQPGAAALTVFPRGGKATIR